MNDRERERERRRIREEEQRVRELARGPVRWAREPYKTSISTTPGRADVFSACARLQTGGTCSQLCVYRYDGRNFALAKNPMPGCCPGPDGFQVINMNLEGEGGEFHSDTRNVVCSDGTSHPYHSDLIISDCDPEGIELTVTNEDTGGETIYSNIDTHVYPFCAFPLQRISHPPDDCECRLPCELCIFGYLIINDQPWFPGDPIPDPPPPPEACNTCAAIVTDSWVTSGGGLCVADGTVLLPGGSCTWSKTLGANSYQLVWNIVPQSWTFSAAGIPCAIYTLAGSPPCSSPTTLVLTKTGFGLGNPTLTLTRIP